MTSNSYLDYVDLKCFYGISFYKTELEIDNNKSGVIYTNDNLSKFKIGDKLPLKTRYYYYPKDFYIYDYVSNSELLYIVKNGAYSGFINIRDIDFDLKNSYVINIDGTEVLNIDLKEDLLALSEDWDRCKQEYSDIKDKYFPEGEVCMILNNPIEHDRLKYLFKEDAKDVFNDFKELWLKKDKYYIEKRYGVLIEALKNLFWELKEDEELSEREKYHMLSLAYEEYDVFTYMNLDAKNKYLNLFNHVSEIYIDNIVEMVEEYINMLE